MREDVDRERGRQRANQPQIIPEVRDEQCNHAREEQPEPADTDDSTLEGAVAGGVALYV